MPQPRATIIQRVLRWRFLFIVNVLLILFLAMTVGREYLRTHEIQKEISQLETQASELTARNMMLGELQTAVQTESFIEREARLKLAMKKPGEQVVVIQEATEGKNTDPAGDEKNSTDPFNLVLSASDSTGNVANATKWWYYFFNKSAYDQLPNK